MDFDIELAQQNKQVAPPEVPPEEQNPELKERLKQHDRLLYWSVICMKIATFSLFISIIKSTVEVFSKLF
jgi:hypothetical protein